MKRVIPAKFLILLIIVVSENQKVDFTKKLGKNWRAIENVVFVFAFGFVMYKLVSSYWHYVHDSVHGKGYWGGIVHPIVTHDYYMSAVAIMIILNSTLVLCEIVLFIIRLLTQESSEPRRNGKYKNIFNKVSVTYKPSFMAMLIHLLLPKLILINMFWIWLPHFQKFAFFSTNLRWYSWIYAYICWELSSWIFHYSCHRVRLLWCIHSPHHAPVEINMSVNWVHFFAEGYYSTLIHLIVLTLLGVNPVMFLALMSIDSAWGIFVHISDSTLKNGRLGLFQHLLITPSHHRVHHARNPLYIDTNFASAVPIWDWMFGTLQPYKDEVKTDYGITRDLDVTNFTDLYFGEIFLLWRDIKNAKGIKNKFLYLVMPPGWTPTGQEKTASAMRQKFLKANPELGVTSRNRLLAAIRLAFGLDKTKVDEAAPVPLLSEERG